MKLLTLNCHSIEEPGYAAVVFDGKNTPVVSDHFGLIITADWEEYA